MSDNIILVDGVLYKEWVPKDEINEFEPIVLEHIKDIFGKNAIYIEKKKITTTAGAGAIPDGFIITLDGEPSCYILEIELSEHDAYGHGVNQLSRIEDAIDNPNTRHSIVTSIYENIQGTSLQILIEKKTNKELHKFLSDIITPERTKSVIVIENLTDNWRTAFKKRNTKMVEFKTFARITNSGEYVDVNSVHLHIFKPVVKTRFKTKSRSMKSKDWDYDSISDYLNELKEWASATYAYYQILTLENRIIDRTELIKSIGNKINDSEFNGYSLSGILSGITKITTKRGRERLDYKSDDSGKFGINKNYINDLKKYFETSSDIKRKNEKYNAKIEQLKEWNTHEIEEYLNRLKKWHSASYAYFEILANEDRIIQRNELISLIGKKINDSKFSGLSMSGIQMGLTSNSTKAGFERLDYKSDDSEEFGINKRYKRVLRKYFVL